MMYKLSKSSIKNLKAVDPRLTILLTSYLMLEKKDIGITYGARTKKTQEKLFKEGKTKTLKSKHLLVEETLETKDGDKIKVLEANAIDIIAYKQGKIIWDREYYADIIADMKKIAKHYGFPINFGWDFKDLDDPYHISVQEEGDGGIK